MEPEELYFFKAVDHSSTVAEHEESQNIDEIMGIFNKRIEAWAALILEEIKVLYLLIGVGVEKRKSWEDNQTRKYKQTNWFC